MATEYRKRRRFQLTAALAILASMAQLPAAAQDRAGERVGLLAANVERAESVRQIKHLQRTYAQYSQFGLWDEMATLFAGNAEMIRGEDHVRGQTDIEDYFVENFGHGRYGLPPRGLHTQLVFRPLINVSADGRSAKGRWWEWSMTGEFGERADWAGGWRKPELR